MTEIILITLWCLFAWFSGKLEAQYFHNKLISGVRPPANIHGKFMILRTFSLLILSLFAGLPLFGIIVVVLGITLFAIAVENWMVLGGANWISAIYGFVGTGLIFSYTLYFELYEPLTFICGAIAVFMMLHDGMYYVERSKLQTGKANWWYFWGGEPVGSNSQLDNKPLGNMTVTSWHVRASLFCVGVFIWIIYVFDEFIKYG